MKPLLFWSLLLVIGCSLRSPTREIASFYQDIHLGEVNAQKSVVKQFPPEIEGALTRYYFYVQLKDDQGDFIDREMSDFNITEDKKQKVEFSFKRILRGRYYLIVEKETETSKGHLDFTVAGHSLSKQLKLPIKAPVRKHSHLKKVAQERNRVKFILTLADAQKNPVDVYHSPEIILEGNHHGQIEELERTGPGKWQFSVVYPEENQLIYLSIRSSGVYLKDLFRFQHVEK